MSQVQPPFIKSEFVDHGGLLGLQKTPKGPAGEIEQAMTRLAEYVTDLERSYSQLVNMIDPVLKPVLSDTAESDKFHAGDECSLANGLNQLTGRVREVYIDINQIMDRIQL